MPSRVDFMLWAVSAAAWTAIVGLAGIAAAVGGSWLQIRNQRLEAFRGRMLEAANDATNALGAALIATRVSLSEVEEWMMDGPTSERVTETQKRAREALDLASGVGGPVDLLYGLESGIGDALRRTRGHLRVALSEVGPTPPELDRAEAAFAKAELSYAEFVHRAREAAVNYGASGYRTTTRQKAQAAD